MRQNLEDLDARKVLRARTKLLNKLGSDKAREKYIKTIEEELEKFVSRLKKEHRELSNLHSFVTERKMYKIIGLLEMEVVLSQKYVDELVGFLRDSDDCDMLVVAAKAFQNVGIVDFYQEFANKAIEKELEKSWRVGCFAEVWAGDDAKELGMDKKAKELYKQAIITIINELRSDGTSAFGDADYDGFVRFVELTEELGMKAKKKKLLKATLEAYLKDNENGSNYYEIAGVYELMGKKDLARKFYKRALRNAELKGDMGSAASIARDAGLKNEAKVYNALQNVKQYITKN